MARGEVTAKLLVVICLLCHAATSANVFQKRLYEEDVSKSNRFGQGAKRENELEMDSYLLQQNFHSSRWGQTDSMPLPLDPQLLRDVEDRFPPPPKVGIHPRIHTSPDELPKLRQHLNTSKMGQVAVASYSDALARRIDDPMFNKLWIQLAAGNSSAAMEKALVSGLTKWPNVISQTMGSAAFMYCALLENSTGCKQAADVLTSVSNIYERNLAKVNPTDDYQNDIMQLVGNDGFGIAYDYAYNVMSDSDRAQVRKVIAAATAGKKTCGVNKTAYTCNGNWNTFHLTLCAMALAIEGEEG